MENLKILVVDDEARMRKLVKDFLTIKGFSVIEAEDGENAVDIFFKQKDIALLILDVMMPKMDGWEVCKAIRQYSKVPIIMLTARGEVRAWGGRIHFQAFQPQNPGCQSGGNPQAEQCHNRRCYPGGRH